MWDIAEPKNTMKTIQKHKAHHPKTPNKTSNQPSVSSLKILIPKGVVLKKTCFSSETKEMEAAWKSEVNSFAAGQWFLGLQPVRLSVAAWGFGLSTVQPGGTFPKGYFGWFFGGKTPSQEVLGPLGLRPLVPLVYLWDLPVNRQLNP